MDQTLNELFEKKIPTVDAIKKLCNKVKEILSGEECFHASP